MEERHLFVGTCPPTGLRRGHIPEAFDRETKVVVRLAAVGRVIPVVFEHRRPWQQSFWQRGLAYLAVVLETASRSINASGQS